MILSFDVTAGHVQRSRQMKDKNCTNCPVALAFVEKFGGKAGVSRSGMWSSKYGRIRFPREVTAWVDNFDLHERPVQPISISLQTV